MFTLDNKMGPENPFPAMIEALESVVGAIQAKSKESATAYFTNYLIIWIDDFIDTDIFVRMFPLIEEAKTALESRDWEIAEVLVLGLLANSRASSEAFEVLLSGDEEGDRRRAVRKYRGYQNSPSRTTAWTKGDVSGGLPKKMQGLGHHITSPNQLGKEWSKEGMDEPPIITMTEREAQTRIRKILQEGRNKPKARRETSPELMRQVFQEIEGHRREVTGEIGEPTSYAQPDAPTRSKTTGQSKSYRVMTPDEEAEEDRIGRKRFQERYKRHLASLNSLNKAPGQTKK